jgi:hypothetical protein
LATSPLSPTISLFFIRNYARAISQNSYKE